MKFEKLSENKIRITLDLNDLKEKDISFHDFMASPIESQDLFLDILEEVNEKFGFSTKNYKVKIEALAMIDGDFVVNITRLLDSENENPVHSFSKKKVKVKRKSINTNSNQLIYKFDSFDDYCYFIQFLSKSELSNSYLIAKQIVIYVYKNEYYIIFNNINENYKYIAKFYSAITEFGTYINNSNLFYSKLKEFGKIAFKNNALKTSLNYFNKINSI